MKYPEGMEIRVGDRIWFNEGANIVRVSSLIQDPDYMRSCGADAETGIFVSYDATGDYLVDAAFLPDSMFEAEGVGLLTEDQDAEVERLINRSRKDLGIDGPVAVYYLRSNLDQSFYWLVQSLDLLGENGVEYRVASGPCHVVDPVSDSFREETEGEF